MGQVGTVVRGASAFLPGEQPPVSSSQSLSEKNAGLLIILLILILFSGKAGNPDFYVKSSDFTY